MQGAAALCAMTRQSAPQFRCICSQRAAEHAHAHTLRASRSLGGCARVRRRLFIALPDLCESERVLRALSTPTTDLEKEPSRKSSGDGRKHGDCACQNARVADGRIVAGVEQESLRVRIVRGSSKRGVSAIYAMNACGRTVRTLSLNTLAVQPLGKNVYPPGPGAPW